MFKHPNADIAPLTAFPLARPMALTMPELDRVAISRRAEIAAALRVIAGANAVIEHEDGLRTFETDGLTAYAQMPMLAVLPQTTAEVAAILKWCGENRVKIMPRGAGTSLSGGALPLADGVLLGLGRFNRILEIDYANRCAVVQPGVTNLSITQAVQDEGFFYASVSAAHNESARLFDRRQCR